MVKLKWRYLPTLLFALLLIFLIVKYFTISLNEENIRIFIVGFGAAGPLALIALQIAQTVIPFIPGSIITLSGGYLFGVFLGTLYSLVGLVSGSIIILLISKKYGRPIMKRMVNKKMFKNINLAGEKHGALFLFTTRMLPFLPHDLISYAVGTTSISKKKFILATVLGFLPLSFIHSYIGNSIYVRNFTFGFYLVVVFLVIGGVIYLLNEKIFGILMKDKKSYK